MNTLFFWLIGIALLSALLYSLIKTLLRTGQSSQAQEGEEFIGTIYHDRLRQLAAQFERGELDKEDYEQARQELERVLAHELQAGSHNNAAINQPGKVMVWLLGIGVPVLAISLYLLLGRPDALDSSTGQTATQQSISEMVSGLEQKLKNNPDNIEGWRMLGRSYAVLENYPGAKAAYGEAYKRAPDNPEVVLDYAEMLAFTEGSNLTGQVAGLIEHALLLDPDNIRGLLMKGILLYQRGQADAAVQLWESILSKYELNEQIRSVIQSMIAQSRATGDAGQAPPAAAPAPDSVSGPIVSVDVSIAPEFQSGISASDTVFIFAQAANGPKMPLAVARHRAGDLPLRVVLDDASAMTEAMRLSSFNEVVIVARVSRSGNAGAASGDLQGASAVINPHDRPSIKLVINTQLP